jgi:hypothetical protein
LITTAVGYLFQSISRVSASSLTIRGCAEKFGAVDEKEFEKRGDNVCKKYLSITPHFIQSQLFLGSIKQSTFRSAFAGIENTAMPVLSVTTVIKKRRTLFFIDVLALRSVGLAFLPQP